MTDARNENGRMPKMSRWKAGKRSTLVWVGASIGLHLLILLLLQLPSPPRTAPIERIEVGLLPQTARSAGVAGRKTERQALRTEPERRAGKKSRPVLDEVPTAFVADRKTSETPSADPTEDASNLSRPEPPTEILTAFRSAPPTPVPAAEPGRATVRPEEPEGESASPQESLRGVPSSLANSPASGEASDDSPLVKAAPLYAHNPPPPYPPLAQRRGWEGAVLLRVVVDEDGLVREVALESSSSHSLLDAAALKAVRRWRFQPARRGNRPVADEVRVPIRFKLEKRERSLFSRF